MTTQTFRLQHGDLNITAINDGYLFMGPSRIFFNGASPAELKPVLDKYGISSDGINLSCTCLVVETPKYRVLIDCGAGDNSRHSQLGQLMAGLKQAAIDPASIDYVVLSHGHFDHVVGCTKPSGEINFPNARYVMDRQEWQYWALDEPADSVAPAIRQNLLSIRGQLDLVDADAEIAEGLRLIKTAGHTFNHCSVEISWGDASLICPVDCFDHPLQVEYPQWGAEWDDNQAQSVESRRHILQLASEKNALVHGFHFDFPGFGKVKTQGDTYLWESQQ